jgi:carbonic anhydrase
MPHHHATHTPEAIPATPLRALAYLAIWAGCAWGLGQAAHASETTTAAPKSVPVTQGKVELPLGTKLADQVRAAIDHNKSVDNAKVNIGTSGKVLPSATAATKNTTGKTVAPVMTAAEAQYLRQKAKANGLPTPKPAAVKPVVAAVEPATMAEAHVEEHWSYAGRTGPDNWGKLKPDYEQCALGQRQSPINIQSADTLLGPAEPLRFQYRASGGSVVHNGHTLQVDVEGDNTLTVRGDTYRLKQFHFHHPAEERINNRSFAMVAHLVHQNDAGQLAVVAVLLDPGASNPLVRKVWTHLPVDVNDRVRLPGNLVNLNELLPADRRYYQFLGSLTTPPCSEGVLWMVLKGVQSLGPDELKLFGQLFPNNARPVQPRNSRMVREAE